MEKRTWREFRETGLLWFVNRTLHLFGWAIVMENEDGSICYPARVNFRGFSQESEERGFLKVTKYLNTNSEELLKEIEAE